MEMVSQSSLTLRRSLASASAATSEPPRLNEEKCATLSEKRDAAYFLGVGDSVVLTDAGKRQAIKEYQRLRPGKPLSEMKPRWLAHGEIIVETQRVKRELQALWVEELSMRRKVTRAKLLLRTGAYHEHAPELAILNDPVERDREIQRHQQMFELRNRLTMLDRLGKHVDDRRYLSQAMFAGRVAYRKTLAPTVQAVMPILEVIDKSLNRALDSGIVPML